MNAAGLFCFNQITGELRRRFRDHAASLYLVGDGSSRLLGQRAYQHWPAPKLVFSVPVQRLNDPIPGRPAQYGIDVSPHMRASIQRFDSLSS
jgi:hypothetical protein